jgi:hypothetical protein
LIGEEAFAVNEKGKQQVPILSPFAARAVDRTWQAPN